jgi:SAM-dependent methyltransferase
MGDRRLAEMYQAHHRRGARYGYIYGGADRFQLFQAWVGTGRRVLDLGCRDGTLTAQWAGGNRVVGVDIDVEALKLATKILSLGGVQGNLNESFPFAGGSFEVVIAGELLEHVFFPSFFLTEVARVLCPGGRFIGSTPNAFRLRNRWRFLWGEEFESDPTHLHRFSATGLERELLRLHDELASKTYRPGPYSTFTIHEGKKRQIRNMFLYLGHPTESLERVAYEFLKLGNLRRGEFRHLTSEEVRRIKEL